MNRTFRYFLIAFGECILIAVMLLLFSKEEKELMILNTIVLSIAYLVNVLGYPALISRKGDDETASYGIAWTFTGLYSIAVLTTVILCYWWKVPFIWQIIAQCVLLFFFLTGIYFAGLAAQHAGNLERQRKFESQPIVRLKDKARMLEAVIPENISEETRQGIKEVIERTGYLIPHPSQSASMLETQIDTSLQNLSDELLAGASDESIDLLITRCKSLLKQRMALSK